MIDELAVFESHRTALVALAYRMLGDMGRAEDIVQETWLRWHGNGAGVQSPKSYLVTIVTRLCLNELDSAHVRREESRSDRLPEPVDLSRTAMASVEEIDRISMAFLVVLQRLSPAERAVLLLREVFDFSYPEIAELVGKNEAACRQLLRRARLNVETERRVLETSPQEHQRLLRAFIEAVRDGDVAGLTKMLAADAIVVADGGKNGVRFGQVRNLPRPLDGIRRITKFLMSASKRDGVPEVREQTLNGQPALVAVREGRVVAAILLSVAQGRIRRVFIHADPAHLAYVNVAAAVTS